MGLNEKFFQKAWQKPEDEPVHGAGSLPLPARQNQANDFNSLSAASQSMASLFVLIALLFDPKSLQGSGLEDKITNLLNLDGLDDLINWQDQAKTSGMSAGQIARTLDYSNFDFEGTENALLDMISRHESGGNYNIVYGGSEMNLTGMTVNEVLQWQRQTINNGSPSSAAGRYQIINKTLAGLKTEMGLSGNEIFDEEMQDRMATVLLERRGYSSYLRGDISEERFMRNLSQEWAALPRDMTGRGYYDGDGLNRALTSPQAVLAALHHAREQYEIEKQPALAQSQSAPAEAPFDPYAPLNGVFEPHARGVEHEPVRPPLAAAATPQQEQESPKTTPPSLTS